MAAVRAATLGRQHRLGRASSMMLGLLAVVACAGDSLILPEDRVPATLVILAGDGQADTVGRVLRDSLVVRITDLGDRPIRNQAVHFLEQRSNTGARIIPDTARTNADGRAAVRWVLGTVAGPQSIRAVVPVSGRELGVDFHAAAIRAAPDTLFAISGDAQAGVVGAGLTAPLVATVTDRYGNAVSGVAATWSAVGGGSVSPGSGVSGTNGQITTQRTLGALPGEQQTIVTIPGLKGSPVVFLHTGNPGPPASLQAVSGNGQSGLPGEQLSTPLVVRLVDAMGNGLAGRSVAWPVATGGGTITSATTTTDATGSASATWTLGPVAGINIVIPASSGFTATFMATSSPAQAATISASSPIQLSGTVGSAVSPAPSVLVSDAQGQPVAGVLVNFAVTGGGGSVVPAIASTDANGSATVTLWTLGTQVGTNTLTASASGTSGTLSGSPVRFTASAAAGPVSRLVIASQPSSTGASGVPLGHPPTVQLQDAYGNDVGGSGVVITATIAGSPPGASLTSATATTGTGGSATFSGLTLTGPAATYALLFTSPGLVGATSNGIVLSGPPATQLALTIQPSSTASSGQRLSTQPVLQLLDAVGSPVGQAGIVCSVTLASGNPTLQGTLTATTNGAGVAAFTDLSISGAPGLRTLGFSASGLASVTSSPIDVLPGAVQTVSILVQPSATSANGAAFPVQPAVLVLDQSGLPVIGVSVSAAVASGSSTLGGQATVSTDLLGIATFSDLSLTGTVGNYSLSISSGVPSATTATINLTPGPASASQSTASVPAQGKTKVATVITVQTRDQSGNDLTTGGHTVVITVTGKNRAGPLTASDNGDGSYTASYTPNKDGDDLIAITLDGTPIAGSPFPSEVD